MTGVQTCALPISAETLEGLATSRDQREQGETWSLDDVADDLGVDLDE